MNTSLLCFVLALSSTSGLPAADVIEPGPSASIFDYDLPVSLFDEITAPDESRQSPIADETKSKPKRAWPFRSLIRANRDAAQHAMIIRAQGLNGDGDSGPVDSTPQFPPTYAAPNSPVVPYDETQPTQVSPFTPSPIMPYATTPPPMTYPGMTTWGTNGSQPFRMGYRTWGDMGLLTKSRVPQNKSHLEIFELNLGLDHTMQTWWQPWLFSWNHDFGYRSWQGPSGKAPLVGSDLPGSVYHYGWDLRLETPINTQFSPFSALLAFNPSVNSDFDHSLNREAFNLDFRGILFWQASPTFMVALGAGFWDRVDDRVIPYAGIIWQPTPRWELRLMSPESRISYYLGNWMSEDWWAYVNGGYHIEAYQIGRPKGLPKRDQVEIEDWRIVFGLRKSAPWATGFLEAGWVLGRHARLRTGPDFDINDGFIGRIGMSF